MPAHRKQVEFASPPAENPSDDEDGFPETPTRIPNKKKNASRPNPPKEPPRVIPKPKKAAAPVPSTRVTRSKKAAEAPADGDDHTSPPPAPPPAAKRKTAVKLPVPAPKTPRLLRVPKKNAVRSPKARQTSKIATPGGRRQTASKRAPATPRRDKTATHASARLKRTPKRSLGPVKAKKRAQFVPVVEDDDVFDNGWMGEEDMLEDVEDGEEIDDMEDVVEEEMQDGSDGYESPTDAVAGGRRSHRFVNPPAQLARIGEDADDGFEQPRGQKRPHPLRTSVASASDVISPHRKKTNTGDVWDHFEEGRTVDSRIATIPECVKTIVLGGLVTYLPLHLFAPEILQAEERARMSLRPDESVLTRVPQPLVAETDATPEQYMTWSKKMILALELLEVPQRVINMYEKHFRDVQTDERFISDWPVWRLYDLRRRSLVKGARPLDISVFDEVLFRQCQNVVTSDMNARIRSMSDRLQQRNDRKPSQPASASTHSNQGASTSRAQGKTDMKALKYSCCFICGSSSHTHDKDVTRTDCPPRWLVYDKRLNAYRTPDTRALLCYHYNSDNGCSKPACRFANNGHRCSLCGGAHACGQCKA
ncbi:hypothetical protein EXIGLDRAFT_691650 [Exidia glandulosa HHB12029]|uniref:Uncharacterized protein n=1 Tax=Exidia glandulosa HHB12029 TaxID=1314781 RepID=A0A166MQX1_EXIGL|nr:hypothetical protein EXIGLDRAFT_691650 [Exidia glandulosa HHB12029]